MTDLAAEIAQAIVEDESLDWRTPGSAEKEILRRYPTASPEMIFRALAIAIELTLCEPPPPRS